jgi:hypothetical protein
MDHFADDPKFTELGEPAYSEYLNAILDKTCEQMGSDETVVILEPEPFTMPLRASLPLYHYPNSYSPNYNLVVSIPQIFEFATI